MTTGDDPTHPHRSLRRGAPGAQTAQPGDNPFALQLWNRDGVSDAWVFEDSRRNRTAIAYTDNDNDTLIREAVVTLTIFRAPMGLGDHGATVSTLVSLAAEAEGQLRDAVADARDHGYTWAEIADRLATSVTAARRRYAAYANWKTSQPQGPD